MAEGKQPIWRYRSIAARNEAVLIDELNEAGREGWRQRRRGQAGM